MKFKGFDITVNKKLSFRNAKKGDKYMDGGDILPHAIVFVKIKDCKTSERDGRTYYSTEDAPHLPCNGHSLTNMAYGPTKRRITNEGTWVYDPKQEREVYVKEYLQTTIYVALDGFVYTGSDKKVIPETIKKTKQPE